MSWGTKIAILYIGFVALIATMVVFAMHENVDLVAPDYYAQELDHQSKIDKIERTQMLQESVTWKVLNEAIQFSYPEEFRTKQLMGSIHFFRPSDASLDSIVKINSDSSGIQTISTQQFKKGVYIVQINWESDKFQYYNEGTIQLR